MPRVSASALQPDPPTILMVEDEPVLLETIAECLRDWGYTVLEAPNATEAIAQLAAVGHVDLVFSDIRMPGRMDGFALARWMRERHPDIRILLTSGYEGQSRPEDTGLSDGPILRKPYELGVLRARVADLVMLRSAGC